MTKSTPKLAQLRALREGEPRKRGKVKKPAKRVPAAPKQAKSPPSARDSGFDRTVYQRIYCRLRRKHGVLADWPREALDELRRVSVGRFKPANNTVDHGEETGQVSETTG